MPLKGTVFTAKSTQGNGGGASRYDYYPLSDLSPEFREQEELSDGQGIIPIAVSSDKTQLSYFSGESTAYPLYLTIGNIDKSLRRKVSSHAYILLGYLPATKINTERTKLELRHARLQIVHTAMATIFASIKDIPPEGIEMVAGDGAVRRNSPIVAILSMDYPEQLVATCTRSGWCPKCPTPKHALGDNSKREVRNPRDAFRTLRHAYSQRTLNRAYNVLRSHGLNCALPWWVGLPHVNVYQAIAPDPLHQLHQGLVKNLVTWLQNLITDDELDARFKRLPRVHGVRYFANGISCLSRVTGTEHKNICKQLLGCILDIPEVPAGAIRCARAILDLTQLSQYRSHTTTTVKELEDARDAFHADKDVLINLGARKGNSVLLHSHYLH
jgi:hypothetical protein